MRRGLKLKTPSPTSPPQPAARAAPYEKGTETERFPEPQDYVPLPRARPPMRRGLKLAIRSEPVAANEAARAAPYEKGTETTAGWDRGEHSVRRARGPL